MHRPRGQFFGVDALFALLIILFSFFGAMLLWSTFNNHVLNRESYLRLTESSQDALNQLVRTAGNATDWHLLTSATNETVDSLGLALEPTILDPDKVTRLFNLTSTETGWKDVRILLGLTQAGYNYSLVIYQANQTPLYQTLYNQTLPNRLTSATDRVALLNGQRVRLKLTVWVEPPP